MKQEKEIQDTSGGIILPTLVLGSSLAALRRKFIAASCSPLLARHLKRQTTIGNKFSIYCNNCCFKMEKMESGLKFRCKFSNWQARVTNKKVYQLVGLWKTLPVHSKVNGANNTSCHLLQNASGSPMHPLARLTRTWWQYCSTSCTTSVHHWRNAKCTDIMESANPAAATTFGPNGSRLRNQGRKYNSVHNTKWSSIAFSKSLMFKIGRVILKKYQSEYDPRSAHLHDLWQDGSS